MYQNVQCKEPIHENAQNQNGSTERDQKICGRIHAVLQQKL